jgi:HD-like signal output (HDOD) protein
MPSTTFPRETLLHVVKTMPAAPRILSRLGRMTIDPTVDLEDVIALLKCDASLTARIIRVANSPYYSAGSEFSSIEEALARVGMSEIYRLAGFAALLQTTDQDLRLYGISGSELRENSLVTALISEALAKASGADANEAYSAGLLRSIGKIALDRLTHSAGLLRTRADIDLKGGVNASAHRTSYSPGPRGLLLGDWESGLVGFCNCEAAAFILTEWRFPEEMVRAIGNHYAPEKAPGGGAMACVLNLAAGAADRLGFGLAGERPYWEPSPSKMESAGVSEQDLDVASQEGRERFLALHRAVS